MWVNFPTVDDLDVINDENRVLNWKILNPIWLLISTLDKKNIDKDCLSLLKQKLTNKYFDWEDFDSIVSWYTDYSLMHTYPSRDVNLWDRTKKIDSFIEWSKDRFDLMNIIEIWVSRLLEEKYKNKWHNVRVMKTTKWDDYHAKLDYIVEFFYDNNKFKTSIWIDLTLSANPFTIYEKQKYKSSKPLDYMNYLKRRKIRLKSWKIPRIVLDLDKDLIYSFINSFYEEVLNNSWKLLESDQVKDVYNYALEELETILSKRKINDTLLQYFSKMNEIVDNYN